MLRKIGFAALKAININKIFGSPRNFGVTVVCFHRISDEIDYSYPSMPIETFRGIIKYFSQNYSVILPDEIGKPTPKPKLIITFDDGYKDFLSNALPILIQYKFSAIMHVVVNTTLTGEPFWTQKISQIVNHFLKSGKYLNIKTDSLQTTYKINNSNAENISLKIFQILSKLETKKRNLILDELLFENDIPNSLEMMDETDLKICLKNNIMIGSHSYTHENLSMKLSTDQLNKEIIESKNELKKIVDRNIECFAFPNGLTNKALTDYLIDAGYKYAFTTENSLYTPQPYSKLNIIPRIILYGNSVNENILRMSLFQEKIKHFINGQ